jgi:pilus assembly protein Flp/PilA
MTDRLWTTLASRAADFAAEESGATAIEYGIIAAGIAGVIIGLVYNVGSSIQTKLYDKIYQGMN